MNTSATNCSYLHSKNPCVWCKPETVNTLEESLHVIKMIVSVFYDPHEAITPYSTFPCCPSADKACLKDLLPLLLQRSLMLQ